MEDLTTEILPMQLHSLTDAACSDVGRARKHNEDSFGLKTYTKKEQNNQQKKIYSQGLYIICDGMGGHEGGEVASSLAVETIEGFMDRNWTYQLPDKETINSAILEANQAIYNINQTNGSSGRRSMGTTLAMLLLQDTHLAIANVGDSRIYRINRHLGLEQITLDHEVGQDLINQGVDPAIAYSSADSYQLTQALGPVENDYVSPDIKFFNINEDSLFLLCSDGLSDNNFIETHWEEYLKPLLSGNSDLENGLNMFIELAAEENGHDNITGILVRIKVRPILSQFFSF